MRLLGIDFGTKRIGLAFSNEERTVAFPHLTLKNNKDTVQTIASMCSEMEISTIVIGESRDFNMNENAVMELARDLGNKLKDATGLSVEYHQEFLTSHQAESERHFAMKEQRSRKKQKRYDEIDASAATIILQSYIDTH